MKKSNMGTILVSIILTLLIASSMGFAAPTKLGKGQIFPPPKLGGTRIEIGEPIGVLTTDTPTFVIHGWDLDSWKTRSKEEQADFLANYTFELYINEEQVALKKWKHYYSDEDRMKTGYYVEFKAGHFESETYTFTGVWLPDNYENSTVVTFISP